MMESYFVSIQDPVSPGLPTSCAWDALWRVRPSLSHPFSGHVSRIYILECSLKEAEISGVNFILALWLCSSLMYLTFWTSPSCKSVLPRSWTLVLQSSQPLPNPVCILPSCPELNLSVGRRARPQLAIGWKSQWQGKVSKSSVCTYYKWLWDQLFFFPNKFPLIIRIIFLG